MAGVDLFESSTDKWYFSYGSNMSLSVMMKRGDLNPRRVEVAYSENYSLCFNVSGIPYTEPAMGGICERVDVDQEPVYGVSYLLTEKEFSRLIASEGGGIAYRSIQIDVSLLSDGSNLSVYTLAPRRPVAYGAQALPSPRYLTLLINGASEHHLPQHYQDMLLQHPTFTPIQTKRWLFGRWLFGVVWHPVSRFIQKGVRKYRSDSGHVPEWFLIGFDCLLTLMWAHHDYIHGVLWGRGDGR
ncbi:uncharacterized protein EAE98_002480 [Botrytis deweyae]|uniref:gamma-glutamylcyclotransferase n=2 Tax=Botrytis TaxID=33196 RepID=A0A4Z1JQW1_9HELO|nr:uncharacterized protein EAE98_002480 [Botrytis deweyae]KAF7931296.1 hypothetical protein EAE99_003767 [Botrytis elliptica]KAF7936261.1 hypothetical protein EAE98_002480 [Botrytis deweyae]TGO76189.1 hypothetical protein BELL_0169g00090 [Botrytis elliptica]